MNAVEVMTSESQERMLAIVEPEKLDEVLDLARKWEVRAMVVGRVNDSGRFRVFDGTFDALGVPGDAPPRPHGDDAALPSSDRAPSADVPVGSLGDGPVYHRPMQRPRWQDELQAADPRAALAARFPRGADLSGELLALLATPTVADKTWVSRQYDHQLFLNTVVGPGADAAVLRLKGTRNGIALSTDGKARFCFLDPRVGTRLAVMEAARNVACAGARPLALVNCLNFGNPEHPEVMWQFSESVDGMSEACEALGIPVIGGNVSFYNESRGADIHPTPVVGVLGIIEPLEQPPAPPALRDGDTIVVLGATSAELGGSEWAAIVHGATGGRPPVADLDVARALHDVVVGLVRDREVDGVHDVSDGGLAVALAKMAFHGDVGFRVDLERAPGGTDITPAEGAFSESACRVVLSVERDNLAAVLARAATLNVPAGVIGDARGARLIAANAFDVALEDARAAWRDAIPKLMGGVAATSTS
jgi:phosphoribosylformylglycinamidine synthase